MTQFGKGTVAELQNQLQDTEREVAMARTNHGITYPEYRDNTYIP